MASRLIVPVARISRIMEHPNASMLGIAEVLGFQTVVGLVEDPNGPIVRRFLKGQRDEKGKRIPISYVENVGWTVRGKDGDQMVAGDQPIEDIGFSFQYKEGDLVVFFLPDTVLTDEWANKLGVKALLKGGNRIGKINLRGEPSLGLVVSVPADKVGVWVEGDNVADYYGATKWEPPVKATAGDAAAYDSGIDPFFDKFTDIQNGRVFIAVFEPGEEVVVSEKIHGTNCRVGMINGHKVAGSMELRRKPPEDDNLTRSAYWFPWSIPGVPALLLDMALSNLVVELFGEVYGNSVQSGFKYDAFGELKFRAFGLKVGDRFLDWDKFEALCVQYDIPVVPVSYRGPFDQKLIQELSDKPSEIGNTPVVDGIAIREGVVVVPAKERTNPKVGRAILKYIGYKYDLLKNKADSKDV